MPLKKLFILSFILISQISASEFCDSVAGNGAHTTPFWLPKYENYKVLPAHFAISQDFRARPMQISEKGNPYLVINANESEDRKKHVVVITKSFGKFSASIDGTFLKEKFSSVDTAKNFALTTLGY